MPKFAAYDDLSIYAVADTEEAAIAKAREDSGEPSAQFSTAPISDDLAAQIERDGWNGTLRSFSVGADGYIIDTTRD